MLGKDVSAEAERLETLQQDVKFVNNLLSQCGMEAPFPFARVVAEAHTTSDIYNLETAVKILISLLNSKQNKFHAKLEASEQELRSSQQRLREAQNRVQQLEVIAQNATEESNRLKSAFALKEKHFNNELRKREIEFGKLREQLQNCLKEPAAIISANVHIENTIDHKLQQTLLSHSPESDEASETDEMTEGPDRVELLEHENANMRQLLASIGQILAEMRQMAMHIGGVDGKAADIRDLSDHLTLLPISWIYDQVKDEIETSLAILSDFIRAQ